jgi:hypothetical protein
MSYYRGQMIGTQAGLEMQRQADMDELAQRRAESAAKRQSAMDQSLIASRQQRAATDQASVDLKSQDLGLKEQKNQMDAGARAAELEQKKVLKPRDQIQQIALDHFTKAQKLRDMVADPNFDWTQTGHTREEGEAMAQKHDDLGKTYMSPGRGLAKTVDPVTAELKAAKWKEYKDKRDSALMVPWTAMEQYAKDLNEAQAKLDEFNQPTDSTHLKTFGMGMGDGNINLSRTRGNIDPEGLKNAAYVVNKLKALHSKAKIAVDQAKLKYPDARGPDDIPGQSDPGVSPVGPAVQSGRGLIRGSGGVVSMQPGSQDIVSSGMGGGPGSGQITNSRGEVIAGLRPIGPTTPVGVQGAPQPPSPTQVALDQLNGAKSVYTKVHRALNNLQAHKKAGSEVYDPADEEILKNRMNEARKQLHELDKQFPNMKVAETTPQG